MDDERLNNINKAKQEALNQSNSTYNALLNDNQNLYNQQNAYAEQYEKTQNNLLDKQLANNEQKIEQQKEIARQNKETEEKKALNDYTAFNNPYGVQAEQMASQGLNGSGLSETTKLGSWNTYQNRLANANKVMQDAFVQYDSDINDARLNNDVLKAQNALAVLQMKMEYAQNYFSNKSTISQNQLSNSQNLDNNYYNRYQTEYNNIQNEKQRDEAIRQWESEYSLKQQQLAEQQRQYDENMAYKKEQDRIAQQQWEKEYALSKAQNNGGNLLNLEDKETDTQNKTIVNIGGKEVYTDGTKSKNGLDICTNPYTGDINPDAKYGVFNWGESGYGYQPNNVEGNPLIPSGVKVKDYFSDAVGKTGISLDNQNLWQTKDGNFYVWDGTINDYIDVTAEATYAIEKGICYNWEYLGRCPY